MSVGVPAVSPAMLANDVQTLLRVEDLSIRVGAPGRRVQLVLGVDFSMARGERVALVGESGSGKSVTARALLRLDARPAIEGRVLLQGRDLLALNEREMAGVRGAGIGMAFQDAMTALDPIMPIGKQVMEPLVLRGVPAAQARQRAIEVLTELGVAHAQDRLGAYVHEFSGGMRQRVVLAMALIAQPQLLIADEPTTALDVRIQQQVLNLLDEIAERRKLSVLLITHDMGVVASFAERVLVMYSGRLVEDAPVDALFTQPFHPYTQGLLQAIPRVDRNLDQLVAVPGLPVPPSARPSGCAFHPRCPLATAQCASEVPAMRCFGMRRVACHRAEELGAGHAV